MNAPELKARIDYAEWQIDHIENAIARSQPVRDIKPIANQIARLKKARLRWLALRTHLYEHLEAELYYGTLAPPPGSPDYNED